MWSCMLGGLRETVISFKFRQNRMNRFRDVGVEICHFLYLRPVAYITACTTVQATACTTVQAVIIIIIIIKLNIILWAYY